VASGKYAELQLVCDTRASKRLRWPRAAPTGVRHKRAWTGAVGAWRKRTAANGVVPGKLVRNEVQPGDQGILRAVAGVGEAGCPRIMVSNVGSWVVVRSRVPLKLDFVPEIDPHHPGLRPGRTVSSGSDHASRGWTANAPRNPTVNRFGLEVLCRLPLTPITSS